MQCPSCQFENMPGLAACGRCGAQLLLASTEIDVHPPRASVRQKRMRAWFPSIRLGFRLRDLAIDAVRPALPVIQRVEIDRRLLLRMIVPGWPQLYLGNRMRGRLMLYSYLALLFLSLLSLGTPVGGAMLGTAVAIHVASVIDVVWEAVDDHYSRLIVTGAIVAILAAVVYFPVAWTVTRWVGVRRLEVTAGPLLAGDALVGRAGRLALHCPRRVRLHPTECSSAERSRLPGGRLAAERSGTSSEHPGSRPAAASADVAVGTDPLSPLAWFHGAI